jgi:hypothetical protein
LFCIVGEDVEEAIFGVVGLGNREEGSVIKESEVEVEVEDEVGGWKALGEE